MDLQDWMNGFDIVGNISTTAILFFAWKFDKRVSKLEWENDHNKNRRGHTHELAFKSRK